MCADNRKININVKPREPSFCSESKKNIAGVGIPAVKHF